MDKRRVPVDVILVGLGIIYPAIVFFARDIVHPSLFIVFALAIVAVRLSVGNLGEGSWRPALFAVVVVLLSIAALDATLAVRAYPVLLSLAACAVFAATLRRPPSLIERIALASGEPWSPALRRYCRGVTLVWAIWLAVNAAVAAGLALARADEAWVLWTGLISYLLSGALFAGEWLLRRNLPGRKTR